VILEAESNSSKVGYASFTQVRLALSFKTKVPAIFGADKLANNGHPFFAIGEYSKWESTGIKKCFQDHIEGVVKALESSL
jgi:hypothetical protein